MLHIFESPGLKQDGIQHFMASFEEFSFARCRDEVVGGLPCVKLTCSPSLVEKHSVCHRAGRQKEIEE